MRITQIVERFGGRLDGDKSVDIQGLMGAESASASEATFAVDDRALTAAEAGACGCVIVWNEARKSSKPLIRCDSPQAYAADLMEFFHPAPTVVAGIHASAIIDATASIDPSATIGPHVCIGPGCRVGARAVLAAGVCLGQDVTIGDDTMIHYNAVINSRTSIGANVIIYSGAVIGHDGFGFFEHRGKLRKWPHIGNVIVEDDVEIGSNTCIDRGKFGTTRIAKGAKLDNLVQVAHNCSVGPMAILAGQAGLAGGVTLKEGVVCGGQVAVVEQLTVGEGARLGGGCRVIGDVEAGSTQWGAPARPLQTVLKQQAMLGWLTEHRETLRLLVKQASKD